MQPLALFDRPVIVQLPAAELAFHAAWQFEPEMPPRSPSSPDPQMESSKLFSHQIASEYLSQNAHFLLAV
jgi:hypothetical protein